MPRKPEQPTHWDVYKVAAKAILLGTRRSTRQKGRYRSSGERI
jgi:hypothetical protein